MRIRSLPASQTSDQNISCTLIALALCRLAGNQRHDHLQEPLKTNPPLVERPCQRRCRCLHCSFPRTIPLRAALQPLHLAKLNSSAGYRLVRVSGVLHHETPPQLAPPVPRLQSALRPGPARSLQQQNEKLTPEVFQLVQVPRAIYHHKHLCSGLNPCLLPTLLTFLSSQTRQGRQVWSWLVTAAAFPVPRLSSKAARHQLAQRATCLVHPAPQCRKREPLSSGTHTSPPRHWATSTAECLAQRMDRANCRPKGNLFQFDSTMTKVASPSGHCCNKACHAKTPVEPRSMISQ
mmetsp:Transcript_31631/g.69300  ORF Transcript_31631/g.69300 Transcript_31631/m.69300 type:complete len:292 (-) Transcript_31631:613-1488(-)